MKLNRLNIYLNSTLKYLVVLTATTLFTGCNSAKIGQQETDLQITSFPTTATELVYYNEAHLKLVKARINANDPYFSAKYQEVLAAGNAALAFEVDPVINKTQIPPSKDMHDYLTYAPYRWPDPAKSDGLPWVPRDGIINPVSRGRDTDFMRKTEFFDAVEKLAWAYYFSNEDKFAEKAIALMKVWYLNSETKVNPHLNFAQGTPGKNKGSHAGVHEWDGQAHIITALQVFDANRILPADVKNGMVTWFSTYLTWLTTDSMALKAGTTRQNHANHYNFQVMGLMLYLNKNEAAKNVAENAKVDRIEDQILPSGIQPREMGRTKSVHYATLNAWLITELALMGRKVGVDLWAYESADGRSLPKAYEFMAPFVLAPETWPYKQIATGGPIKSIALDMPPLFSKVSTSIGIDYIDPKAQVYLQLSALDALRYPPVEMLPEIRL